MRRVGAYPGSFNPPTVAHLAVADAAREQCHLDQVELVVSRVALAKEQVARPVLADRVAVLEQVAARVPWVSVVVREAQLVADLAEGYDVVVLGADKWAQVLDPAFYGDSTVARDRALSRLPEVALVARPPHRLESSPPGIGPIRVRALTVPDAAGVSSSGARAGRRAWMVPEAAAFDAATGAWSDPDRYEAWLAGRGQPAPDWVPSRVEHKWPQ
ncbi:MAG TPA: hypothetical protein VE152_13495 [Acidimicrobiales bacterium]|nr:hypothetical protein [Acidimicrobiales bacterium]